MHPQEKEGTVDPHLLTSWFLYRIFSIVFHYSIMCSIFYRKHVAQDKGSMAKAALNPRVGPYPIPITLNTVKKIRVSVFDILQMGYDFKGIYCIGRQDLSLGIWPHSRCTYFHVWYEEVIYIYTILVVFWSIVVISTSRSEVGSCFEFSSLCAP